jgi:ABC-type glycerol-3-phosphate transport system substrate-binding protein
MVRDFEEENPDVLIKVVPKSGYVGIHNAMLAEFPEGELPDLAVAFPSMIAEYAAAGVVAPLDPYVYDLEFGLTEEDLDDVLPAYLEAGRFPRYGRQTLAFPFAQNAVGMWVNQSLLRKAGWERAPSTWAEFEQACFDVASATGARCYPFVESVSTFNAWLYSRGGRQLDEAGRQATFNGAEGVESLALLRRLMDAGLAWRPDEPYGDYVAFAHGQAAFTFSSTGNSNLYRDAYEGALYSGVEPFQWRQTMLPQADPDKPATALYGGSFFLLKGDPDRQLAAWRLIRWFTDTEQTARWAESLEAMPVRASALRVMTDTLETYPFFRAQVEQIVPYGRPEPAVAGELEIRDTLYTAIISVTQGFADPQTALDEAARNVNTTLSAGP